MHSQHSSHCSDSQKYRKWLNIEKLDKCISWEDLQMVTYTFESSCVSIFFWGCSGVSHLRHTVSPSLLYPIWSKLYIQHLEVFLWSSGVSDLSLSWSSAFSLFLLYPIWSKLSLFLCFSGVSDLRLEPLLVYQTWASLGVSELVSGWTITRVIIPASSGLPPPRKSAIKWMPFLTNSAAKWSPAQKSTRPDHQRSLTSSMQKQSLGRG